jgi:acyl carrier protein
MSIRLTIIEQIQQIAAEQEKNLAPLTDDLVLIESGLDSLGFAILVARLEDALGLDPFTASEDVYYPVTLGEFIRFYENAVVPPASLRDSFRAAVKPSGRFPWAPRPAFCAALCTTQRASVYGATKASRSASRGRLPARSVAWR